jgi:poly(A) polymerase/tRNA nucleotidyltransferase (CCA-adding enzyme)
MKFPLRLTIPDSVVEIGALLNKAGFESYLVGGCVRDLFLDRVPKDWDIATNATPEDIEKLFPHSHYDNTYGTVKVINEDIKDETLKVIEVTTYRTESGYSDRRRPDKVSFSPHLSDDLSRRDFTINAIAIPVPQESSYEVTRDTIVDLFGGIEDLSEGVIRTVGSPSDRFSEDALRLFRAVRFSAQLNFVVENETFAAIEKLSNLISEIAIERVQVEFSALIMSDNPSSGLEVSRRTGLLSHIIPELIESVGVEQNQAHSFTVWEHLLRALQATADKKWPLHVRLAALFHDISKPATREFSDEKNDWTFYGHEVIGSRVTKKILERFKYPKEIQEKVTKLVRWHMFFSDTEEITLSAVRRLVRNVGEDLIWDLMNVRIADRIGTGRPKEEPYRLRKYASMIEEALRSPISVKGLALGGDDLIETFHVKPGPLIGDILNALMEEVLEDPTLNTKEKLHERVVFLMKLSQEELRERGDSGKKKIKEEDEKVIMSLRKKHYVQ